MCLSLPFSPPSSLMPSPAPEDSIPTTPSAPDRVLAGEDNVSLQPPTPLTNLSSLAASPRGSFTPSANAPLVPETEKGFDSEDSSDLPDRRRSLFRRPVFWLVAAAAVVAVVLAVILPVYFTVIKPKTNASSGGGNSNGGNGNGAGGPKPNGLTTGGDGSVVTMDNGTEFTYHNPFGGFCMWSPPFPPSIRSRVCL